MQVLLARRFFPAGFFYVYAQLPGIEAEHGEAIMDVALIGVGKMGRAIEAVVEDAGYRVVARLGSTGSEYGRGLAEMLAAAQPDVAFEFTAPGVAAGNMDILLRHGTPTFCCTTGLDLLPAVQLAY